MVCGCTIILSAVDSWDVISAAAAEEEDDEDEEEDELSSITAAGVGFDFFLGGIGAVYGRW
jgi:hypothetical protein